MSKSQVRRERKRKRYKQKKINAKLKKKLFGHLVIWPCCYCKAAFLLDELTVEHLIPLCLGGTNDHDNIALACQPCNHSRGKEAWNKRQQLNKQYYEQYLKQHSEQNRERALQESATSTGHCEGQSM